MNEHELTHERCSELLAAFAGGGLDAEETVRVEAHVAGCPGCESELQSIMALRAGDEPLTEIERTRLRRGVAAALSSLDEPITDAERTGLRRGGAAAATDVFAQSRRPSRMKARLATALGAAALLAVFGVAIVSLGSGGGDDEGTASSGRIREQIRNDGGGGAAEGDTGVAQDAAAAPQPRPSYDKNAGRLSPRKLRNIGEGRALTEFGAAYSAKDATALKDEYVRDLADQAEAPVDSLIQNCAEEVYAAQPYAALPAYAAEGTLDGRDALVLGFAWTEQESGPLDQFMLWTWPRSSCDQPLDYRFGPIAPRK